MHRKPHRIVSSRAVQCESIQAGLCYIGRQQGSAGILPVFLSRWVGFSWGSLSAPDTGWKPVLHWAGTSLSPKCVSPVWCLRRRPISVTYVLTPPRER